MTVLVNTALEQPWILGCDSCGTVGWNWPTLLDRGWRRFTVSSGYPGGWFFRHHCVDCAARQDAIRGGLVHGIDPQNAVNYDPEQE